MIGITRTGQKVHAVRTNMHGYWRTRCGEVPRKRDSRFDLPDLPPMLQCQTCQRSIDAEQMEEVQE